MNTQLAIKENDLELVVSEKNLGSLTTNAKQIRDIVKANLSKYDISNYNDDNIDQAKKDKAMLNKAAKALNAKRVEVEKEFMKPLGEFKEVLGETVQLIAQSSGNIDAVVKQNEQQYKDRKRESVKAYFDNNNVNLVDINKVFKPEWLNKTASMKSVCSDIDTILTKVESDIQTIESMPEDADVLRTYYMDTLNINSTIQYGNRLKEQRERAKAAEEAKLKAEQERKQAEEARKVSEQEQQRAHPANPFDRANQQANGQLPFGEQSKVEPTQQPELLTRAFKVTTTRENIIALGNFMNERGIDFDKIELA